MNNQSKILISKYKMEHIPKQRQKLSLSSTYSQLHSALWQQKEKNFFFQKQNLLLNTKINSLKETHLTKPSKQKEEYAEEKQRLRTLYAEIRDQEQWIKQATVMIEEKNFDKQYRQKVKIQKKLNKTNKKCKDLTKKLHHIQKKVDLEDNEFKNETHFLGYYGENQEKRKISPNDVLAELEKQNQELTSLLNFKHSELANENRIVKCLNNEIIDLLEMKNWVRKFGIQSQKLENSEKLFNRQSQSRPNSTDKSQSRPKIRQRSYVSSMGNKSGGSSAFRQEPKLKITTY